jgi:hypothetical protein
LPIPARSRAPAAAPVPGQKTCTQFP